MKKGIIFIIALCFSCITIAQTHSYSTFYYQRATLFEKLTISNGDIVFLGNSITNGGEWMELLNNPQVKNRGISGDICMGVYDRLGIITEGKPAKLFLMIGINDIAQNTPADTIVSRTSIILDKIKSESPQTHVYLQSILPVNDCYGLFEGHTKHWETIRPLNIQLQQMAESKEVTYILSMLAFAERAWLGGGSEYFDRNGVILPADENDEIFKSFADFEQRMLRHKEHIFSDEPFPYVRQTNVKWHITDAFPNNGDLSASFPPEKSFENSYLYDDRTYNVRPAIGAGIYLRHVWGTLVPAFFDDPQENHTAYAYTWVYSPEAQDTGLWLEFQNYSRSESDLPAPAGSWDYKGSRAWLNDTEILPPVWTATHTEKSNEIILGNENLTARPPIGVHLNKGWNKVLLKLPVGKFSHPEVRLVKWMFTCVFVTPDGQKAVDGLIYSPEKIK